MILRRLACFAAALLLIGSLAGAAELTAEQTRAKNAAERARKDFDRLLRFLENKSYTEKLETLYTEHDALAKAAHEFLFDNKKYAIPAKAFTGWNPYKDIQPGHDEMEKLVDPCIRKHNEIIGTLTAAMGVRFEVLGKGGKNPGPKAGHIRFYEIYSAQTAFEMYLQGFKATYEKYDKALADLKAAGVEAGEGTAATPLIDALGKLSQGKYAEAKTAGAKLSGFEKRFFKTVCDFQVLSWNKINRHGHTDNELGGTALMNAYRISLDIRPMAHHPKLHEMAADYVAEQAKHKFFGHVHPKDETRKTHQKRAKRVGYNGQVSENCASWGEGVYATWMWRTDAGHHRGMINPKFKEVGLGCGGTGVLNPGHGSEMDILKLIY